MSQGSFEISRYEASFANFIMPIRVQPETVSLTDGTVPNDPPAGATDLPLFARARKGNTEYGVGARSITISFAPGSEPTGYSGDSLNVPVLTEAAFAAYSIGDTVTYLGATGTVVGRKSETFR